VIAYPIGAVLDKAIGYNEGTLLSKPKMKKLFEMYEKDNLLNPTERRMLSAALELQDRTVSSVMTPLERAYMLDINTNLDNSLLR
jgi:metal transporter CNNM